MVWRPDAPDTLVRAENRLICPSELLSTSFLQQIRFLKNFIHFEISHANCFLAAIDIVSLDDGVFVWTGRNADFNLRVSFGEIGKHFLDEGADKTPIRSSP